VQVKTDQPSSFVRSWTIRYSLPAFDCFSDPQPSTDATICQLIQPGLISSPFQSNAMTHFPSPIEGGRTPPSIFRKPSDLSLSNLLRLLGFVGLDQQPWCDHSPRHFFLPDVMPRLP
jgi:hypothetical protein